MTTAELLKRVIDDDGLRVQFVNECVLGAKSVKAKKGEAAHTRVEIATQNLTPNDLMYLTCEPGEAENRKPPFVGVILWIPTATYEAAQSADAVDPHASSTGTPTPRDASSSSSSASSFLALPPPEPPQ